MIQEKDFLYRVPVKTAPITTPRGQIRNPEILVDLEGGEFMHGNILDANSTNKLINQSVKEAVDDKFIESVHVTKDLLDAETSARTKGDEDLGAKIQAEQTRAEGKEREISDKLAIVDGDSNTEGSFRKAIADVVAAAPEDLDTLKEIADKLAGNDDLHTALNQAITEKADATALANEVTRATGAESGLQAAIATKADATALSNYVLTTALNQQVDTLNTAISAKQDAGNYIKYERIIGNYGPDGRYLIHCGIHLDTYSGNSNVIIDKDGIQVSEYNDSRKFSTFRKDIIKTSDNISEMHVTSDSIASYKVDTSEPTGLGYANFWLKSDGVHLYGGDNNHVLTSNASTIDITEYAKKTELPAVPTKTSQLTNDSNFIAASATTTPKAYEINRGITLTTGVFKTMGIGSTTYASFSPNTLSFYDKSDVVVYGIDGIHSNQYRNCVPTTDNEFKSITDFASAEELQSVKVGLSAKQNKIKVNEVDITDIETADIAKLRTIVTNLINALSASGLIKETVTLE